MNVLQHDSRYSWTRLAISLAVALVGCVGMWATVVVLPAMQEDFGSSRSAATLPYTMTMVGYGVGNLVLGRAVDRWGISSVLSLSAILLALGFGLSSISTWVPLIIALHFLSGLGAAASFGPLIADVSQWFLKRRGVAVGIVASGNYLSGAVWPPFIAWIMEDYGWRGAYLALTVLVLVVVLPGAQLLRRRLDEASTDHATSNAAARASTIGLSPRKLQVLLSVAGVGCCVAMAMPQVHIVALCIDRGFGAQAGAKMLSVMLAGGVLSRLFFGALSDRIGGLMVLLIGGTLQMLTLFLFLIQGDLPSLYLISLVFGLSQGGIVPSYAIIVREYMPPREAGRRVGSVIAATIVGMGLGGWMAGWLYDLTGTYTVAIWNGIAWNTLTVIIVLGILIRIGGSTRRTAPA